jgi:hypothetical protein
VAHSACRPHREGGEVKLKPKPYRPDGVRALLVVCK